MTTPDCPNLILYHANCLDGSVGALVLANGLETQGTALMAVQYNAFKEDVLLEESAGRTVYIVDFSFTVEFTRRLCAVAKHVVFLDHHKTAMDRFEGLSSFDIAPNLFMRLDNDRSGAQLAWDYYVMTLAAPDTPIEALAEPWYVAHTGDRDLWKFELEGTKEITAALYTVANDLNELHGMICLEFDAVFAIGAVLERVATDEIERSVSRAYHGNVAGMNVPIVNACKHQSEIGNQLSQGKPFAAVWYLSGDKVHVSLRSQKTSGADVEEIAKLFGGGGHRNAAGFTVPVTVPMEFIPDALKH